MKTRPEAIQHNSTFSTGSRTVASLNKVINRTGASLKARPSLIRKMQCGMLLIYAVLLLLPCWLPWASRGRLSVQSAVTLAYTSLWGVGYPLILLLTLLFGRVWCGLLCPDGMLTEAISHYGRQRSIPKWLRWTGWPFLALLLFNAVYAAASVAENTFVLLFLLGLMTSASLIVGVLYSKGRRVWCLYLCPNNLLLTCLARLAPLTYQVDRERWDAYAGLTESVHCAPLVNIRQMARHSACHACTRCLGYRNAVELAFESPLNQFAKKNAMSGYPARGFLLTFMGAGISACLWMRQPAWLSDWLNGTISLIPPLLTGFLFVLATGPLIALILTALLRLAASCHPAEMAWPALAQALLPSGVSFYLLAALSRFLPYSATAGGLNIPDIVAPLLLTSAGLLGSLFAGWKVITADSMQGYSSAWLVYATAPVLISLLAVAAIG